ncbi:MAG: hypothetical protein F4X28_07855 [Acidimicrobiaceae bacterium]|nr:hypothetical protein [Acidimicrobiaceae bacterium]MYE97244.1 hypothetical protein [Acidimicrobiaceae bacterium]
MAVTPVDPRPLDILDGDFYEAPRIDGRPGPYGAGPWPERPVSEANKSGMTTLRSDRRPINPGSPQGLDQPLDSSVGETHQVGLWPLPENCG